jgi:hypothetical protein
MMLSWREQTGGNVTVSNRMSETADKTRIALLARAGGQSATVTDLIDRSCRALPHMFRSDRQEFVQTVRRDPSAASGLRPEGANLRYTAMVALGTAWLEPERQREVLAGLRASDLAATLAARGAATADLGGSALAAWAAAEVRGEAPTALFDRLLGEIKGSTAQPTVIYAWMLTALVAGREFGDFGATVEQAAERLLTAQGDDGLFPHALPAEASGRLRSHVGSFADQVYPLQALARYHVATGDPRALEAANRTAARIVDLQGDAGQWWWHYDVRTGGVVEGYPVYSVHQHAMGPMVLFDLREAGGADHVAAIAHGLAWLRTHPETRDDLLDDRSGVIWRKVGRREPRKAVRYVRSATTVLHPALRFAALDRVFPPGRIDYECRPYELGWLLYAWLATGVASGLRPPATKP